MYYIGRRFVAVFLKLLLLCHRCDSVWENGGKNSHDTLSSDHQFITGLDLVYERVGLPKSGRCTIGVPEPKSPHPIRSRPV